jgi:tetratricopeptide (TPR) repeat protein
VASEQRRLEEAQFYYEQGLEVFQSMDDRRGMAFTLGNLAINAGRESNFSLASEYHERSIELFRDLGDSANLALALANQAETRIQSEEYAAAPPLLVESLRICVDTGSLRNIAQCALVACTLAIRTHRYEEGAVLFGVIERLRAITEMPSVRPGLDQRDDLYTVLMQAFGPVGLSSAALEGRDMTDEQLIDFVSNYGE